MPNGPRLRLGQLAPDQHVQGRAPFGVVQPEQGQPDAVQFGQGGRHGRVALEQRDRLGFPALVVGQHAEPGLGQPAAPAAP